MTLYHITVDAEFSGTVSGTRPFARKQTGGQAGAWSIVDATGAYAHPLLNGEAQYKTFAPSPAGVALADAIVNAGNNSPALSGAVTITGTVKVANVLTANSTFTGSGTITKSYQWFANGVAIAGATSATYTPVSGDIGKAITVAVAGTSALGFTDPVGSAATVNVIP